MRASLVLPPATWNAAREVDAVSLDYDHRHRRRIVVRTESGSELLLDLPQPARLRDGDGLLLDDGNVVRVRALPEPVMDFSAAPELRVRLAWHLGNRHFPLQVIGDRLRVRADSVIADMARHLGADVAVLYAAFDPEPGAYDHSHHD